MLNKYDKYKQNQQMGYGSKEERELTRPGFAGEKHAIAIPSLARYNYLGPGTRVDLRTARNDPPINDLDQAAKTHDTLYFKNSTAFKAGKITKSDFLGNVKSADDRFKTEARNSKDASVLGKVSANLIGAKEIAEDLFLPTSIFSGAGLKKLKNEPVTSPIETLQKLVNNTKKLNANGQIEIQMINKINNDNNQEGGFLPVLAGVALSSILSALTGSAIDKLVDYFSNKSQKGNGVKDVLKKDKINFLMSLPPNDVTQQLIKLN